jgi:hypothetical protein
MMKTNHLDIWEPIPTNRHRPSVGPAHVAGRLAELHTGLRAPVTSDEYFLMDSVWRNARNAKDAGFSAPSTTAAARASSWMSTEMYDEQSQKGHHKEFITVKPSGKQAAT